MCRLFSISDCTALQGMCCIGRDNTQAIRTLLSNCLWLLLAVGEADRELAVTVSRKIKELKTLLDVSRLSNVDAADLPRVTEELVVTLQNAATKIGLDRPAMEASP